MSYEIYTVKKDTFERTLKVKQINSINWNDDIDNVFISFDFETTEELKVGEWVELYEKNDEKTIFYGIITTSTRNNKNMYKYSGYDTGFFLLKNKISIQFKKNTLISNAIISACNKINIKCDISEIKQTIDGFYKNKTVAEILKILLEEAIKKGLKSEYYFDCYNGKLNLFKYETNNNLKGYIANIYKIDTTNTIDSFTISKSIDEMKNQIQVISSDAKSEKDIKVTVKDENNITKYGLLQETIEAEKDKTNYKEQAEKKLSELNIEKETLTINVLSDYNARKGIKFSIDKENIKVKGTYLIKSSKHNIVGTKEKVELNIMKY